MRSMWFALAFFSWVALNSVLAITKFDLYPTSPSDPQLPKDEEEVSSPEIPLKTPIHYFSQAYKTIYVSSNGLLSFLTEVPTFYNIQFPLDYPIIAPFYADLDATGRGTISFKETEEPNVLLRASEDIRRHFSSGRSFQPVSVFVATWNEVGYYPRKSDKVNTFQVVLATDGRDTYAIFLYPTGGIQWLRGQGKTQGLPDASAQVGFMSGDGRVYILPVSGTDIARKLDQLSNVGRPGVWMFRVGQLGQEGTVEVPDINLGINTATARSCSQGSVLCHPQARCTDHFVHFCCECEGGTFGNGRVCLKEGEPIRLNGKVEGQLNGVPFTDLDLHSYIITTDGRSYTAVSGVPSNIGYDMQTLYSLGDIVGWLFAIRSGKATNGFQQTGGVLNRTVELEFPQTGNRVTIFQSVEGLDAFGYLRIRMKIDGTAPEIPEDFTVEADDYTVDLTRAGSGVLRSQSSHSYRLQGNTLQVPFRVDQVLAYEPSCPSLADDPETNTLRLRASRLFITYDRRESIIRFATTNKITTLETDDPCEEGRKRCGPNSACVVDGDAYRCVCNTGYEFLYEDDANGETAACIDVNECTSGRDNCHTDANCINVVGSFQCRCLPGYVGDGFNCERSRTCADLRCDINARCEDTSGSLECVCNEGYTGNGYVCTRSSVGGTDCTVIPFCDPHAECVFNPALEQHICRCLPGYFGDGEFCHEDDNGGGTNEHSDCNTLNNCHPYALCKYDLATQAFQCRCNAGYEGDGYYCQQSDVDCTNVNICSIHADCVFNNVLSKNKCVCRDGYDGDGITCNPTDECNSVEQCSPNAECRYDVTSLRYRCVCSARFTGDGKDCRPSGGCTDCHPNADCIYDGVNDRSLCRCKSGFIGNGQVCSPRGEPTCYEVNNCDANADCIYDEVKLVFRCKCREGFVGDGLNCVAGRSCLDDPYSCDRKAECVRAPGLSVYMCQCLPGFRGDGFTCTEIPRHEGNFLLVSQGMSIVRMPFQQTRNEPGRPIVMKPLQMAVGIDIDCSAGHIYWADVSGRAIRRATYDGSDLEDFINEGIESPEGVAVDHVSRNIYWTDSLKDTIEVARLDSPHKERKVLISTGLVNPRGISVYPARGRLFWTDWNRQQPKIETAALDGSSRRIIVSTELGLPNSLTIDVDRDEVCWADAGTRRIECCGIDGQGRRTITTLLAYPFGLTNTKSHFFWTDWETRKIEVATKIGGQPEPALEPPLGGSGKLFGLVAVPERCSRSTNPCSAQNGGCPHLCLPNSYGGRSCLCADNTEDGTALTECNEV